MVILHKRNAADVSSRSDQRDCHFVRNVEYLDQNRFIALESNRISHKKVGEIVESGVVHKGVMIPPGAADATELIGQRPNEACRKSTVVTVSKGEVKFFLRIASAEIPPANARPTVDFLRV